MVRGAELSPILDQARPTLRTAHSLRSKDAVLQPDGKLVVVGTGWNQLSDFAVARYTTDGRPDSSFGQSGLVLTSLEPLKDLLPTTPPPFSDDDAESVSLGPDGTLVVLGLYQHARGLQDSPCSRAL